MKKTILLLSSLALFTAFNAKAAKKDECTASILSTMNGIAKSYTEGLGMEVVFDKKFIEIESDGFFIALNKASKNAKTAAHRNYRVRLDNGSTYDYWKIKAFVNDQICVIQETKSEL